MSLARWQATIVDDQGNVVPSASVTVRREVAGSPLATIYSDREGTTPLGNPLTADSDGFAAFHVPGGAYQIVATSGAFSRTWRYVGIGLSSEQDAPPVGVSYVFDSITTDSDPGSGLFRLDNATPSSATTIYFDNVDNDAATQTSWLDTLDDGGSSTDRGTIFLRSVDNSAVLVATVTGSVVDGTGYRKVSITVLSSTAADTFVAGSVFGVIFTQSGSGSGDVVGPGSATDNDLATFDGTTGKLIQDSGKTTTTVGTGKQTVWIPASAMISRTTNGAASGSVETTTNKVMLKTLDFDASTQEFAQFQIKMPKSWDEGTVTFKAIWSHPSTSTNFGVAWALQGIALSDGDAADTAFGTEQVVTDTGGTTDDIYHSAESSAITIGGSPAQGDWIVFQVKRVPANGSDTMAVDARLHGIRLLYTTNANTDD